MNKKNHIYHLVILLVCLVVLTFNLTTGLFAKYVAYDSASDSARVAKFDVTVTGEGGGDAIELTLKTFETAKLSASTNITVASNSEVAVKYGVVITLGDMTVKPTWLDTVTIKAQGAADDTAVPGVCGYNSTSGKYEIVFEDLGSFPAGVSSNASYTLMFNVCKLYKVLKILVIFLNHVKHKRIACV